MNPQQGSKGHSKFCSRPLFEPFWPSWSVAGPRCLIGGVFLHFFPSFAAGVLTFRISFTGLFRTKKAVVAPWPQLSPQWPQVWPHGFTGEVRTQKVVVAPWPQLWPQVWPHGFTGRIRTQKVVVAPWTQLWPQWPAVAPSLYGRGTHSKSCFGPVA